jgi:glycosyltransferase involved in cell wall biosynthesis
MRILVATQVLPLPLDAGPKVRAYYVLRYLVESGHDVHLVSFVRPGDSEEHVAALRRLVGSLETVPLLRSRIRDVRDGLHSLLTRTPFLVLRDYLPAMRQAISRLAAARSFDALHADQLWMAPYGMQRDVAVGMRVLDQHNAVFQVPRRMADQYRNPIARMLLNGEASHLQAYERDACRRFDRVVWVTDEDRRAVLPSAPDRGRRDRVIPIATDPDARPRLIRSQPFRVTFLGGLHWPPNRDGAAWFLERVWPRIAEAVPAAVCTVMGRDGARALPRADEFSRVEITGYVDDPGPYLAETAVFVVPLKSGAGMRVKILDAWCWGVPVVSTTVGAEGLLAEHDGNLLIADDHRAFADAVIGLFRDPRAAERLADGGRATVERHYDWRKVYTAWDELYARPARFGHPARPADSAPAGRAAEATR